MKEFKRKVPKYRGKASKMYFGKYKDKTVGQVLNLDPSYIIWANDTISWFKVTKEIYNEAINLNFDYQINHYLRAHKDLSQANSSYWFEDDNGSWLS